MNISETRVACQEIEEMYLQPAGRVPMLLAQWAIHSGLVVPNAALLPVQEDHQLVVV